MDTAVRMMLLNRRRGNSAPSPSVMSPTAVVNGANIDITFTTAINLLTSDAGNPGVVGFYYSVGEGVSPSAWVDVPADESYNHVFSYPIASLVGVVAGSVVNIDPGYSLTSPPTSIVVASDSSNYVTPTVYNVVVSDTTPAANQLLTLSWDYVIGPPAQVLTYRWQRSTGPTTVSTVITYTPDAGVVGQTLIGRVTSTLSGRTAFDDSPATSAVASALSAEAQAVINSYATPPNSTRQGQIATLVDTLIAGSVWAKIGALYVTAAPVEADAFQNWKSPGTRNLSKVGTVTFVADKYMSGNGSTGRYVGATALDNAAFLMTTASAHVGIFTNGAAQNKSAVGNTAGNLVLGPDNTFGSAQASVNSNGFTRTLVGTTGHVCASRTLAALQSLYENGAKIGTDDTEVSFSVTTGNFALGGAGSDFSTARVLAGHVGGGLTAGEVDVINDALVAYFTAIAAYP